MQAIYTQTITSSTNVIFFNNIPQTYTDLMLLISARCSGTSANQGHYIQINSDGTLLYSGTTLRGNGSSPDSYRSNGNNAFLEIEIPNDLNASNVFSSENIYITNYTNNTPKQVIIDSVRENNSVSTAVNMTFRANLYRGNAPVTSLGIGTNISAPNFIAGSTFTLYGISR